MSELNEAKAFKDMLIEASSKIIMPHIEGVFSVFEQKYKPQSEWISVEDRLPKVRVNSRYDSVPVDVFCDSGVRIVDCHYTYAINEWWDGDGYPIKNATHWMPLPEPPTEKSK